MFQCFHSTKHAPVKNILQENPTFELQDGLPYAVFPDNSYSWDYAHLIYGYPLLRCIAHIGNYENAVLLQPTIGM